MSKLTYEELILLDNLIYLKWNAKEDEKLINIVYDLLNYKQFDSLMDAVGSCIVRISTEEWFEILKQIISKPNFRNLRMKNVDSYIKGMRFACFVDDENNATVVFRGTATVNEWKDNGEGAYKYETIEQVDALNFINSLEYDNITVTGHSKGGNNAQYVTVLSPKITRCISVNGQGFSDEFVNKYKEEINQNYSKVISINAKYDYVNCLFNSIAGKCCYIQTETQINPFDYHKANILLDENGDLRRETNEAIFSEIINRFSISLISGLPKDIEYLIVSGIINTIELILCKGVNYNIIKAAGEYLIMFCYENCFDYREIFNITYAVLEVLILPLIFWSDLVSIEETNSKELLSSVIKKIQIVSNGVIRKLDIIDKDNVDLIKTVSNVINNLIYELEIITL